VCLLSTIHQTRNFVEEAKFKFYRIPEEEEVWITYGRSATSGHPSSLEREHTSADHLCVTPNSNSITNVVQQTLWRTHNKLVVPPHNLLHWSTVTCPPDWLWFWTWRSSDWLAYRSGNEAGGLNLEFLKKFTVNCLKVFSCYLWNSMCYNSLLFYFIYLFIYSFIY